MNYVHHLTLTVCVMLPVLVYGQHPLEPLSFLDTHEWLSEAGVKQIAIVKHYLRSNTSKLNPARKYNRQEGYQRFDDKGRIVYGGAGGSSDATMHQYKVEEDSILYRGVTFNSDCYPSYTQKFYFDTTGVFEIPFPVVLRNVGGYEFKVISQKSNDIFIYLVCPSDRHSLDEKAVLI